MLRLLLQFRVTTWLRRFDARKSTSANARPSKNFHGLNVTCFRGVFKFQFDYFPNPNIINFDIPMAMNHYQINLHLFLLNTCAIFRWRHSCLFLEHPAEMLWIFEAQSVCYPCNAFTCGKLVFCPLDDILTDIIACSIAGCLFYHIPEIVGRHAQFVGAKLHRRQAECQLHVPVKVIVQ